MNDKLSFNSNLEASIEPVTEQPDSARQSDEHPKPQSESGCATKTLVLCCSGCKICCLCCIKYSPPGLLWRFMVKKCREDWQRCQTNNPELVSCLNCLTDCCERVCAWIKWINVENKIGNIFRFDERDIFGHLSWVIKFQHLIFLVQF